MASAAAALHDLARLHRRWLPTHAGALAPGGAPPAWDDAALLGAAQHAGLGASWAAVPIVHQLAADGLVDGLLAVLGGTARVGAAAAAVAALRQVLALRAELAGGRAAVDVDSAASASLAVYLPAGLQPCAWAGEGSSTDVFVGVQGSSGGSGGVVPGPEAGAGDLPLAVAARTFTQWVPDAVDESVGGIAPLQPVGGTMRRNADGATAKVAVLATVGTPPPPHASIAPGDGSYEVASALLALEANEDGALLDSGALLAAAGALSAEDPVLCLAAAKLLHTLAARSEALRGGMLSAGVPGTATAVGQKGAPDPRTAWFLSRLAALA